MSEIERLAQWKYCQKAFVRPNSTLIWTVFPKFKQKRIQQHQFCSPVTQRLLKDTYTSFCNVEHWKMDPINFDTRVGFKKFWLPQMTPFTFHHSCGTQNEWFTVSHINLFPMYILGTTFLARGQLLTLFPGIANNSAHPTFLIGYWKK